MLEPAGRVQGIVERLVGERPSSGESSQSTKATLHSHEHYIKSKGTAVPLIPKMHWVKQF